MLTIKFMRLSHFMMSPYIGEWHESVIEINGECRIQRLHFEKLFHHILQVHSFSLGTAFPHSDIGLRVDCG